jgi:hypothetical protein
MSPIPAFRRNLGHTVSGLSLPLGLVLGVIVGLALPDATWVAAIVAVALAGSVGVLGLLYAGDLAATACPCCSSRTVTASWQQTFQCTHCQALCVLASIRQRQRVRVISQTLR